MVFHTYTLYISSIVISAILPVLTIQLMVVHIGFLLQQRTFPFSLSRQLKCHTNFQSLMSNLYSPPHCIQIIGTAKKSHSKRDCQPAPLPLFGFCIFNNIILVTNQFYYLHALRTFFQESEPVVFLMVIIVMKMLKINDLLSTHLFSFSTS